MQVTGSGNQLVCVLRYILDSCLSGPQNCFHSAAIAQGFIAMEINQGYKHLTGHVQVRGSRRGVTRHRTSPPDLSPSSGECTCPKKTQVEGKI